MHSVEIRSNQFKSQTVLGFYTLVGLGLTQFAEPINNSPYYVKVMRKQTIPVLLPYHFEVSKFQVTLEDHPILHTTLDSGIEVGLTFLVFFQALQPY